MIKMNVKNKIWLFILALVAGVSQSCEEEALFFEEESQAGVYFQTDSIVYSFGVTPFEIKDHTLQIPLKIIGTPSNNARAVKVKVDEERTTAIYPAHYEVSDASIVLADSVNGYLDLKINRETLGEEEFKVTIELQENEFFKPVNETYKRVVVYFNNQVNRPTWNSWPISRLGTWDPMKYIKFIELFREMETVAPSTYNAIVAEFGPDLKNMASWPWNYTYSMEKYVLVPLYRYFMVDHPELGITVPKPASY